MVFRDAEPLFPRTISADLRLAPPMNARASGHRCHSATAFLKGDDSASAPPRFNDVFLRAEGSQENGVNSRISKIIPKSMCVFLYFCAVPFRDYMIYIYINIYIYVYTNKCQEIGIRTWLTGPTVCGAPSSYVYKSL